jgi:hypothetical protein
MAVRDELRSDGGLIRVKRTSTCSLLTRTLTRPRSTSSFMAVFSPIQLIASVPPFTRFFTLTTFLLSLFYLYLQWKSDAASPLPYLTLVPGSSLFYPWTFLTSVFVETTIYEVRCHTLGRTIQVTHIFSSSSRSSPSLLVSAT